MVSVLRLSIHCKFILSPILGKALDVCHPLSGVMNITNARHSTNQEIHGSIPCTFIFLFSFFFKFLWSKRQERHDATLLLRNRRLPATADKHLAVQLSSNHGEYVDLD